MKRVDNKATKRGDCNSGRVDSRWDVVDHRS